MKYRLGGILLLILGTAPTLANPQYQLVGEARLSVLLWKVYDAQLFSSDGRYHGLNAPLLLKLHYLRTIERDALIDATREQLQQVAPDLPPQQTEHQLQRLATFWPPTLAPGDSLSFELSTNGGTFRFNDQPIGQIHDAGFARAFLSIWLADNSAFPRLSQKLRGES